MQWSFWILVSLWKGNYAFGGKHVFVSIWSRVPLLSQAQQSESASDVARPGIPDHWIQCSCFQFQTKCTTCTDFKGMVNCHQCSNKTSSFVQAIRSRTTVQGGSLMRWLWTKPWSSSTSTVRIFSIRKWDSYIHMSDLQWLISGRISSWQNSTLSPSNSWARILQAWNNSVPATGIPCDEFVFVYSSWKWVYWASGHCQALTWAIRPDLRRFSFQSCFLVFRSQRTNFLQFPRSGIHVNSIVHMMRWAERSDVPFASPQWQREFKQSLAACYRSMLWYTSSYRHYCFT